MKEGTMERRGTTIKKFILVTLTHADRRPTAKKELVRDRLRQLFDSRAVLVAKEPHSEGGYHLNAGVFNRNASKHTATKKIRECFTEWEGGALDVKFHKAWAPIWLYLIKEDKELLVWGEYTLEEIIQIVDKRKKRNQSQKSQPEQVIDKLLKCHDWYQIYNDPVLRKLAVQPYESIRNLYEDPQVVRDMQTTL